MKLLKTAVEQQNLQMSNLYTTKSNYYEKQQQSPRIIKKYTYTCKFQSGYWSHLLLFDVYFCCLVPRNLS